MKCKLVDVAEFNPKDSLKKGTLAKKVAMEKLRPFCRDIPGYTLEPFKGGTKFRNGDTIMARITPCLENGKTAKVSILNNGEIGFGSTEYIVFRAKEGISDEDYLYYLICSPLIRDAAIKSMVGSSGRQRVQTDVIQNIEIDLPSVTVQKKIGSLLRSFDDKIELNNKINKNLEQQARTLFAQWLMENDGDYEFALLSDLALINPDSYSLKDSWEFVNYLDTSSITDGIISEIQHIKPATEKLPSRARRIIAANDVVFSTVRPSQRHFGIINEPLDNMLASTGFAVLRSNHPSVSNELLYLCLTEDRFIEKMQQLAEQSTSTFPSIKPSDLGSCEIPYPISQELTKTLKAMFTCIANNQKENRVLTKLRDNLLPKLMSGEIKVLQE